MNINHTLPSEHPFPTLDQLNNLVDEVMAVSGMDEQPTDILVQLYRELLIGASDEIPADISTLHVGYVDTFAREGLHFLKAKAKQGKTSALCIIESVYLSESGQWGILSRIGTEPLRVLHIDTEQKPYDSQRFKRQVLHLADTTEEALGDRFLVANMRSLIDYAQKRQLIEVMLDNERPDVVVIDGVVDLMANFNDLDESKSLIAWLMTLADKHKCVMLCVLHTNKNAADNNMRGHLGTMSEQKCDTTSECIKDEQSNIVTVKCAVSRHRPFPEWAFTWDDHGNLLDANQQRTELALSQIQAARLQKAIRARENQEQRILMLQQIIRSYGGSIARNELSTILMNQLSISKTTASMYISGWLKENIIYEADHKIKATLQSDLFNNAEG